MAAGRKKNISIYILPLLFCGLLVALALLRGERAEPVPVREIQESEPLTLTDAAIENYLCSDGFLLDGERVTDAQGQEAAALTVVKGEDGEIDGLTLSFPLPTYFETKNSGDVLASLKAAHDAAAQRGETLFLALFDAISATDGRVAARRDSAITKLGDAMGSGKAAALSVNSWRFSFSLEPGELEGTVTILFEKIK